MSRLTYEEASKLDAGTVQVINNVAYQLVTLMYYEDRIELYWENIIAIYLRTTMVKFPGAISYYKLSAVLEKDQFPKDAMVKEVVYK